MSEPEEELTELQKSLTKQDVKEICDLAEASWDKAGPRTRLVRFRWRGKQFQSTLTSFRMLVETASGEPVCCRWS